MRELEAQAEPKRALNGLLFVCDRLAQEPAEMEPQLGSPCLVTITMLAARARAGC